MGNQTSKDILVGTLNFSGICLSPFEYHDCTMEKDFMSSKFEEIMNKYITDQKFIWDVGRIDQKLQKERYTPIYNSTVGVQNNKLVNKNQFEKLWKKHFENNVQILQKINPSQIQIQQTMLFDWMAYETFLNVVYNQKPQELFNLQTIKSRDPKPYLQFLKQWHSKPYLSNQKKMQKVFNLLKSHNFDVLCLQQAQIKQGKDWNLTIGDKYNLISQPESTSIIIYKKKTFPSTLEDAYFQDKYRNKLNFNNDTVFVKRGKYLLVSSHLSSKPQRFTLQAEQMFKVLQEIRNQNYEIDILLGIDCNHFMNHSKYSRYNICPAVQTQFTTIKKRTAIQLQTKKTNKIVKQIKDQIVTNLYVMQSHVVMIDGKNTSEKTYLPCEEHPFDHFIVWARIQNVENKELAIQRTHSDKSR